MDYGWRTLLGLDIFTMKLIWQPDNPLWIGFSQALVPGIFLRRPNRFVAYVNVHGKEVRTHVPDPGRLKELMLPGTPVYLAPGDPNKPRKTLYSLLLIQSPDQQHWVSLNTQLPNTVVRMLLKHHQITRFIDFDLLRPEVRYGDSRIDFLLEHRSSKKLCLLEVKSVTLVHDNRWACFPDAPTVRGTRHVRELIHAVQYDDYLASILFVIQRGDSQGVYPNSLTDPAFCAALKDASEAGISLTAMAYTLTPEGIQLQSNVLPVRLTSPD